MTDYEEKANNFAKKYGIKISFIGYPEYRRYFDENDGLRWVFKCRLSRNGRSYTFTFGQSLANGRKEPSMYDILACLTKYDPGSFENFCGEYGYDTHSRRAQKVHKAVVKEWEAVERLFGDLLTDDEASEEFREIA